MLGLKPEAGGPEALRPGAQSPEPGARGPEPV